MSALPDVWSWGNPLYTAPQMPPMWTRPPYKRMSNIGVDKIYCANCNEKHKADNPNCPSRIAYITIKKKTSTKDNINNQNNYKVNKNLVLSQQNFPGIEGQKITPRSRAEYVDSLNLYSRAPNYATITKLSFPNNNFLNNNVNNSNNFSREFNYNRKSSFSNHGPGASSVNDLPGTGTNDLFSPSELMSIMSDMMDRLRNCKTKEQQFQALADLTLKYLYGNKP
jgi:hypothetical protein